MLSSVIRSFAYDAAERVLDVTFHTGRRYLYRDVQADVFEEFGRASSKGTYFNAAIRDRYSAERQRKMNGT